jgi:hypothetical protein
VDGVWGGGGRRWSGERVTFHPAPFYTVIVTWIGLLKFLKKG